MSHTWCRAEMAASVLAHRLAPASIMRSGLIYAEHAPKSCMPAQSPAELDEGGFVTTDSGSAYTSYLVQGGDGSFGLGPALGPGLDHAVGRLGRVV